MESSLGNLKRLAIYKYICKSDTTFPNRYNRLIQLDHVATNDLLLLSHTRFESYSGYILQLYDREDTNNEEEGQTYERIGCFDTFRSRLK